MAYWSEAENDLATKLWKEGLSAGEISARLNGGFSRNAVIGRMHRMGLARGFGNNSGLYEKLRQRVKREAKERVKKAREIVETVKIREPMPIETDTPPKLFRLLDWPDTGCRWPYDAPDGTIQFGCACQKASGLPYCEGHAGRAYTAPKPAQQRKPFFPPVQNNAKEFA